MSKTLRVALGWNIGGGAAAATRFFIHYTGTAPTNADLATFDAAIITAYGTNLKSLCDTGNLLTSVHSIDLDSSTGAVDTASASQGGTRGSSFIGASTSLVCSYRVARHYRGGHSRGYWPFGIQTDLTDRNSWSTSFLTACDTGLGAFFTAVLAAGWGAAGTLTQANVSYYHGFSVVTSPTTGRARNVPTLRGTPLIDTVTSRKSQSSVGSQRRRDDYRTF